MNSLNLLRSAFMAGICIGIAGFGFLSLKAGDNYLAGCVIFAFALIAVVNYKLALYTGTAGFIKKNEFGFLGKVLLGNIIGCATLSLLTRLSPMPLQETAQALLQSRLDLGIVNGSILSTACGFIMTTAVTFARKDNMLPLFFGVPQALESHFSRVVPSAGGCRFDHCSGTSPFRRRKGRHPGAGNRYCSCVGYVRQYAGV